MASSSGTILSDAIQFLYNALGSLDINSLFQRSRFDESLANDLTSPPGKPADAEEKQAYNAVVRDLLDDIQQCIYLAEQSANMITTRALKPGWPSEPGPSEIKSRSDPSSLRDIIMMEINEAKRKLETMLNQKNDMGLGRENFSGPRMIVPTNTTTPNTTYVVRDSVVFGRNRARDKLVGLLLSKGAERNKIDIITMTGMGGIGKTTLAKMVYNDAGVQDTFDLRAWLLVADKPYVPLVTNAILESVSDQTYSGSPDSDLLQSWLSAKVKNKRFLLVLDDVWAVHNEIWNVLRASLLIAANGSKIIITTRDPKVASTLSTVRMFCVKPLSEDDSWPLLSKPAFEVGITSFDAQLQHIARNNLRLYPHFPIYSKHHISEDLKFTKERLMRPWVARDFVVPTPRGIGDSLFSNSGEIQDLLFSSGLMVAAVPHKELAFDDTSRSRSTLEGSSQLANFSSSHLKHLQDISPQIKYLKHALLQIAGVQTGQYAFIMNKKARVVESSDSKYGFGYNCGFGRGRLPSELLVESHKNMQEQCLEYSRRPKVLVSRPREYCNCLAYCTLFPKDYELEGNTLIQLWMAAGLIQKEPMEDIAATYLAIAQLKNIISLSRVDYGAGKKWYRVLESNLSRGLRAISRLCLVTLDNCDNDPSAISKTVLPCHVLVQGLPTNYTFRVLGRFPQIRAVLLPQGHMSNIDCLPHDFFISLEFLEALDLSGTKLSELPSSVGNAKCLRYLDLSDTPIKQLPETMDSLEKLQTLKLRNCNHLYSLPKGTRQLTSLRHLDLGTLSCLDSMPPEMGALTQLRTLSNFVVGEEPKCQIAELKHMNDLRGRLCLSNLEYVASPDEAKEANLSHKQHLTNLELRWTTEDDAEEEVIEHLQPHTNLRDLRILCYGGSKFPSWISNQCFGTLEIITLFRCENCQVLHSYHLWGSYLVWKSSA